MATQTWSDGVCQGARRAPVRLGLVLLILFAVAVMLFGMMHAIERHGEDAVLVKQCYDNGHVLTKWKKPDGRFMYGCELPGQVCFGVVVTEGDPEQVVTCFKNKSKTLEKLFRYFLNQNAVQIW